MIGDKNSVKILASQLNTFEIKSFLGLSQVNDLEKAVGQYDELLAAGIPKKDIVIGFHPPEARQYTEFAIS